jgi:hypothetical protein
VRSTIQHNMNSFPLPSVILVTLIVAFVVWKKFRPIVTVSEDEAMIVERLGSYSRTLTRGAHWIWPFIDSLRPFPWLREKGGPEVFRIKITESVTEVIDIDCITADLHKVKIDISVTYKVVSASDLSYKTNNFMDTLENQIDSSTADTIRSILVSEITSDRVDKALMSKNGKDVWEQYGIKIVKCRLKHCEMPHNLEAIIPPSKKGGGSGVPDTNKEEVLLKNALHIEEMRHRATMTKNEENHNQQLQFMKEHIKMVKDSGLPAEYFLRFNQNEAISRIISNPKTAKIIVPYSAGSTSPISSTDIFTM